MLLMNMNLYLQIMLNSKTTEIKFNEYEGPQEQLTKTTEQENKTTATEKPIRQSTKL